ncbi:MAG: helix-turn-helix domain-containing protein [Fusobacteriaceae bacterium]
MEELELMIMKLKKKMKEKGITQEEMARELKMSVTTVNSALNFKNVMMDNFKKIVEYIENK